MLCTETRPFFTENGLEYLWFNKTMEVFSSRKKINLFIFSLPGEIFNNIEPAGGKFSQIILLTLFEIFTYIKRITVQFT